MIVDAGPLVAAANRHDRRRAEVQRTLQAAHDEPLIVPAFVAAEADYLLGRRVGRAGRRALLADLAGGRFVLATPDLEELAVMADLERRYEDLDLGLADLSIVVLSRRYRTRRLLTFDERDFRAVRPLQGGTFTLLPGDATDATDATDVTDEAT